MFRLVKEIVIKADRLQRLQLNNCTQAAPAYIVELFGDPDNERFLFECTSGVYAGELVELSTLLAINWKSLRIQSLNIYSRNKRVASKFIGWLEKRLLENGRPFEPSELPTG